MNRFDLARLRQNRRVHTEPSRPATVSQPAAVAHEAAGRPTAERPKILFLDDEDRILNALAALFRYKYQVFTATNGEQALAILRQCHVHVVVSDQRMPGMTGVEFLREAKAVSPKSVRILLTGFSDLSAIIDSVNDGEVYRFLNKPWGNQEIQAVIADALSIAVALEAGGTPAQEPPARDAAAIASQTADRTDRPAVLMLHDKRETFDKIRPLLDPAHTMLYARSVDECLDALHRTSIAVVVSDLQVDRQDTSELLKLLKQEHPQILTIVLAGNADADHVVELINQAKIFRYVLAPFTPQKLKFFIDSALRQFQRYRNAPALLGEQRAQVVAASAPSRITSMIRERLRSLRTLLAPSAAAGR